MAGSCMRPTEVVALLHCASSCSLHWKGFSLQDIVVLVAICSYQQVDIDLEREEGVRLEGEAWRRVVGRASPGNARSRDSYVAFDMLPNLAWCPGGLGPALYSRILEMLTAPKVDQAKYRLKAHTYQ